MKADPRFPVLTFVAMGGSGSTFPLSFLSYVCLD